MTVRGTVNQVAQIGVESTHGTPVAAGKLIDAFTWEAGEDAKTKQFRGTGRQYPSASSVLTEASKGQITGPGDFAQLVYVFASMWGSGSPALHSPSTTAYDWIWTPGLTGSYAANAKSFTVQIGDPSGSDAEQYAFLVFNGMTYSFGRQQEMQITAPWFAQTFTDGATLTGSPTVVEQLPATGAQFNLYMDPTSGAIGTTLVADPLMVTYEAGEYYGQYWPIKRANASFTDIVDKEKKHTLKVQVQANSTGIGYRASYLQTGALVYVRVDGVGPTIDGVHSVTAHFQHDMACFVSAMEPMKDIDGVYGVEYTLVVAEDAAWGSGEAQKMTLTNLLSAL